FRGRAGGEFRGKGRQPRDIASRPRQARNQAEGQHVANRRNDDRDRRCGFLGCQSAGCPVRDEHVDVESKEFLGQRWQPIIIPRRPTELDQEIATFDPAEIAKSGAKRRNATCLTGRGYKTQEADTSNLKRLRARRERPRRRRAAAHERDELAAPHSITSSARASSVGGTSRPRALAVLRLIANSNLVGCSTGSSAGLAPCRIRCTYQAPRLKRSGRGVP